MDDVNENITTDLHDYITFRVNNSPNILSKISTPTSKSEGGGAQHRFTNHLIARARGCFLYVKLAMDLIERGQLVVKSSSFKVLPVSLNEIFLLHFNLKFPSVKSYEKMELILSVALASLYPLTAHEIYHTVNASSVHSTLSWEEFIQRLKVGSTPKIS